MYKIMLATDSRWMFFYTSLLKYSIHNSIIYVAYLNEFRLHNLNTTLKLPISEETKFLSLCRLTVLTQADCF